MIRIQDIARENKNLQDNVLSNLQQQLKEATDISRVKSAKPLQRRYSIKVNNSHAKISPLIENDNFDTKTQLQGVSALRDYIENPSQYKNP